MKVLTLGLLLCHFVLGQAVVYVGPDTKGACSPANTGNNNTFTFTCGIGKEQGDQILRVINRMVADQVKPSDLLSVLREIKSGQLRIENGVVQIRSAVAEIQKKALPRVLDDGAVARVKLSLKPFAGQAVEMTILTGDSEANAFGLQLANLLKSSSWDVRPNFTGSMVMAGVDNHGVFISSRRQTPAMDRLVAALETEGISINRMLAPSFGTPGENLLVIEIIVFPKPQ